MRQTVFTGSTEKSDVAKPYKNHYKKGPESIAVLGFFALVPFFCTAVRPSSLANNLSLPVEQVTGLLSGAFKGAGLSLQRRLVEDGTLYDDGIVEVHPVIQETHVLLYLKLPATIAIHIALSQIRQLTCDSLEHTALSRATVTYHSLFSSKYLAFCQPFDCQPVAAINKNVYSKNFQIFKEENDLDIRPSFMQEVREEFLGKRSFMTPDSTIYK